jgi:hypothetical protein
MTRETSEMTESPKLLILVGSPRRASRQHGAHRSAPSLNKSEKVMKWSVNSHLMDLTKSSLLFWQIGRKDGLSVDFAHPRSISE